MVSELTLRAVGQKNIKDKIKEKTYPFSTK